MVKIHQLFDAIKTHNNEKVWKYLEGINAKALNGTDAIGWSPLHRACFYNNSHAVVALLAVPGIHANKRDYVGFTPIMRAARSSSVEALRIMLEDSSVAINVKNEDGEGLEELVGTDCDNEETNNKCLEMIMEERSRRENVRIGGNDKFDHMRVTMKGLIEQQELEKKALDLESNQEVVRLENEKLMLEKQLATLQQSLDQIKHRNQTNREQIKEKHYNERATLEMLFEMGEKVDNKDLADLKEPTSQLTNNLRKRKRDIEPDNDDSSNLKAAKETLECPVCMDTMKPPSRIWMCPASHLVCEPCKDRLKGKRCPTCRNKKVTLRAFIAEKFSQTLFC